WRRTGCRRRRRRGSPVSARENLAVEVGAELAEGLAAAGLLAAVPRLDGRFQDASLVADLLVQRDVAGLDAGHDVGTGDADQVGGFLGAQDRVGCCIGLRRSGLSAAADGRVLEQASEVALDEPGGLWRQLDVTAHDL